MRTLRGHDVQDTLAVTGGADSARQCRLRQSAALADSARQCRRDRRRCLASRRPRPLPAPTGGPSLTPRPHRGGPGRSPSLTSHPVRGPVGHGRSRSVTAPRPRPQAGGAPPASWHGGGGGGGDGEALAKTNHQHPPTPPPRLARWGMAAPWWIGAMRPAGLPGSLWGGRESESGRRSSHHIAARADGRRAQSPASACEAPAARSRSEASHNLTDWPTRAREAGRAAPAGGGRPAAGPRLRREPPRRRTEKNNGDGPKE